MCCPLCKVSSIAHGSKFIIHDLTIKIACPACGKKPMSANWHCDCGRTWHTCPRHAKHCAHATMVTARRTRKVSRKLDALSHTGDNEAILDDDLRQASKKARIDMEASNRSRLASLAQSTSIPYRMLTPALRARFPTAVGYEPLATSTSCSCPSSAR